jgi:hypothetical protein
VNAEDGGAPRCDRYDGELRDMVSVRLRVTESVERCTIRRHEYDIIEDDSMIFVTGLA